jgi:sugar phosphate isomerase/epimerase
MTRPISLAALTVLELTPPEMVSCAADAGYSHVGIRLLPATPTEQRYDIVGDTPLLREVERRLADTGIKVLDVEIFRIRPDTRVGDYEAAIATAARLGARELLVAGNDPDEARLTDTYGRFCDLAAGYGLGANLEFMPWTDAKDLAQGARIVGGAGRDNAGLMIDPFHLSRSQGRVADIATIPRAWLRYMQFCDVPAAVPPGMDAILAEARGARLFPGDGGLDLLALLRAMPADLPLSVEIPMSELARTVGAVERARRALLATRRVLAMLARPDEPADLPALTGTAQ